jgi:GNAT superfamily N-acetyltransferase
MPMPTTISIAPARWPDDVAAVQGLFQEYVESLGVDLSFQDVDAEFAELPGKYAPPGGMILIARDGAGQAVGCVALRPLAQAGACEMKRLYVRPAGRGQNLGRQLAEAIIAHARLSNYKRMLLDTLAPMRAAQALYASLGFRPTAPYYDNPLPGTRYLALDL